MSEVFIIARKGEPTKNIGERGTSPMAPGKCRMWTILEDKWFGLFKVKLIGLQKKGGGVTIVLD